MHFRGRQKAIPPFCILPMTLIVLLATALTANAATKNHPFCRALAAGRMHASSGAHMWCFGPLQNGPALQFNINQLAPTIPGSGFLSNNVNAASLSEDITTNGERGSGQAETSIAASGQYVLEGDRKSVV